MSTVSENGLTEIAIGVRSVFFKDIQQVRMSMITGDFIGAACFGAVFGLISLGPAVALGEDEHGDLPLAAKLTSFGDCNLRQGLERTLDNRHVAFEFSYRVGRTNGPISLQGLSNVRNHSATSLFCQGYISFFDSKGDLIGNAAFRQIAGKPLGGNDRDNLVGFPILLPAKELDRITKYSAVFYYGSAPFGDSLNKGAKEKPKKGLR